MLTLLLLAGSPSLPAATARGLPDPQPRLFVLTDIADEPDDEEPLVRLLSFEVRP